MVPVIFKPVLHFVLFFQFVLFPHNQRSINRLNTQPSLHQLTGFPLYDALQSCINKRMSEAGNLLHIHNTTSICKLSTSIFLHRLDKELLQRKPARTKISPYNVTGLIPPFPLSVKPLRPSPHFIYYLVYR